MDLRQKDITSLGIILRPSYTNRRDSLTSHQVCETGDGCTRRVDFTKFTMAHGHFALMGGFTVGVPLTANDEPSLDESQDSPEVVSLRLEQLFALVEKKDHRKARFDLFAQISENLIKQLHEYSYIQHLVTMVRLLSFVWHCYQRQRLGLETSPLEVLTVGHVFMAILIEIFWWNKPPYLRLPIQNLDRQALCQAIPGLEQELDGRAAARGKKHYRIQRCPVHNRWALTQCEKKTAYTSSPNFRFLQWLPSQDKVVGLRSHANFPAIIVSVLCACHSAIIWFPEWRVEFPTYAETCIWDNLMFFLFASGAVYIPGFIAIDIASRALFEVSVREGFGLDDFKLSERNFEDLFESVELTCLITTTTLVVLATINFRRASEGIYAVGPGDISKFNVTIF